MAANNRDIVTHMQEIVTKMLKLIEDEYECMNSKESSEDYIKMNKIQFTMKLALLEIKLYKIKYYIAATNFDQKLCYFC